MAWLATPLNLPSKYISPNFLEFIVQRRTSVEEEGANFFLIKYSARSFQRGEETRHFVIEARESLKVSLLRQTTR